MPKFRKKPVVIEAEQWNGCGFPPGVALWVLNAAGERRIERDGTRLKIHTLEGVMEANEGDWIIKGVAGELYPCKPGIFEATYEAVDE